MAARVVTMEQIALVRERLDAKAAEYDALALPIDIAGRFFHDLSNEAGVPEDTISALARGWGFWPWSAGDVVAHYRRRSSATLR
jgi:hypothetical protein